MIESPAYYNAYQYVMKGIQKFAISCHRIPFQKSVSNLNPLLIFYRCSYIVDVNHKSMRQPQYLLNDYVFDFGVLTKSKNTKLKNMKPRFVDSRNSRCGFLSEFLAVHIMYIHIQSLQIMANKRGTKTRPISI